MRIPTASPDNWEKRQSGGTTGTVAAQQDGTAFDGAKYVRMTKTSGTGAVSLSQSSWNNAGLKFDGFVGLHANEYFFATACVRANSLDSSGAKIRLQLFEKNAQGQNVFIQALESSVVTGGSNGWITLATPIFRPHDYVHAGCTFNYLEMNLQILSAAGYVDFDSAGLVLLSNQPLNASVETDTNSDGTPDYWDKRISSGTTGSVTQGTGDAVNGDHYIRLTKTAGTGVVSIAQSAWNNSNLGPAGFVASHARESFVATAFIRGNALDTGGTKLRIQIFQKTPDGTVSYVQSIYSQTTVTGTTGWTKVTIPAFRPCDYLSPGCTLERLEVVAQTTSLTGWADVDDLNLHWQPQTQ
ncbi:MAG: hypothetical protein ACYC26_13270 [Phycisphaerales bacterium]